MGNAPLQMHALVALSWPGVSTGRACDSLASEEAAESVGATKAKTFKDVTLPLIWKGVLVGSLYSFILGSFPTAPGG